MILDKTFHICVSAISFNMLNLYAHYNLHYISGADDCHSAVVCTVFVKVMQSECTLNF